MTKNHKMQNILVVGICALLLSLHVFAGGGHYTCGGKVVDDHVRRCPDGSPPIFKADLIKPRPAEILKPPRPAELIKPRPAEVLKPSRPADLIKPHEAEPARKPRASGQPDSRTQPGNVKHLFGVWHTRIPGVVYQTPSNVPEYNNVIISPGVKDGDLIISPNGSYAWNAHGGKSGKWEYGDGEAIILIDTVENRKWKVQYDKNHTGGRDIMIWDGTYWYDGIR